MAKERLFPSKAPDDDKREPQTKFDDLATAVLAVPKSEIDQREKRWQKSRHKTKKR